MKRLLIGLMLVLLATAPTYAKQSGMMCSKKSDCCQMMKNGKMKKDCKCCKGMNHKSMKHMNMHKG